MKIAVLIARLLLGPIFVAFGLNGFLNFLSMGPMPTGLAGQFIGALFLSYYYWVVAALQIIGGALLLCCLTIGVHSSVAADSCLVDILTCTYPFG